MTPSADTADAADMANDTTPPTDWAAADDHSILSDALSHYSADTLTGGLIEPLAAGRIRLFWVATDQQQPATYGALLAADALYRQSDRLQRRTARTAAARANVLGMALAAGRLAFWCNADDGLIRDADHRAMVQV